jgi:signal transduction histidine kinase
VPVGPSIDTSAEPPAAAERSAARRRLDRAALQVDHVLAGALRPGKWTAAAVTVLAVLVAVEIVFTQTRLPLAVGFAGIITIAGITIRRTNPLLALGIAVAARILTAFIPAIDQEPRSVGTAAQFIAIVIIGYSAARWIPRRRAPAAIAAVLVTIGLTWGIVGDNVATFLGGLVGWIVLAAFGYAMRVRAERRDRQLEQVRLAERHDLARELHDIVAHHVSAIAVQADVAKALQTTNPAASATAIDAIKDTATEALTEMRRMVGVLRDGHTAEPAALTEHLRQLVASSPSEPQPTLTIDGDILTVPSTIAAAVQRIVQESLTNARKYGRHASFVTIHIHRDAVGVTITVSNDGDVVQSGEGTAGYGLVGMDERAQLLGGEFSAGPRADGGWLVEAFLPVRNV